MQRAVCASALFAIVATFGVWRPWSAFDGENSDASSRGASGVLSKNGLSNSVLSKKVSSNSVAPNIATPLRQRVRVTTHPDGASIVIRPVDAPPIEGVTPWEGDLPVGTFDLRVEHADRNPIVERRELPAASGPTEPTPFDIWLDPAGALLHQLGEIATGPAPKQVAFSPDGRELWVSVLGGIGVQVYDVTSGAPMGEVKLGEHGAVEVLFSRDGATVFASQMETASVFEIDRGSRVVRRQLHTGGTWSKVMELSADERTLFVSNWISHDVSEIDLVTGTLRRKLPTVKTPRGLYATRDGRSLYVAGFEHGELERIDLATGERHRLLRTGGAMRHLVADASGQHLYADDMSTNTVYAIDVANDGVRVLARTDHVPNTIDLTPDGRVLFVSNRGRNNPKSYYLPGPEWGSVLAIDTATGAVLDAIVGGNQTTGLDVSADGTRLAFSDFLDDRVKLFSVPPTAALVAGGGGRAIQHRAEIVK